METTQLKPLEPHHNFLLALTMIVMALLLFMVYTLLHELAHIIAIVAFGGTVEHFVFFGFFARVYHYGLDSNLAIAVTAIAGELLPLIIFLIIFPFYRHNKKFKRIAPKVLYHFFFFVLTVLFVFPLFGWIFLFHDFHHDPIQFLFVTGFHPLALSFIYLAALVLVLFFVYKKRLPQTLWQLVQEKWNSKNREAEEIVGDESTAFVFDRPMEEITAEENASAVALVPKKKKIIFSKGKIISFFLAVAFIMTGIFVPFAVNPNLRQASGVPPWQAWISEPVSGRADEYETYFGYGKVIHLQAFVARSNNLSFRISSEFPMLVEIRRETLRRGVSVRHDVLFRQLGTWNSFEIPEIFLRADERISIYIEFFPTANSLYRRREHLESNFNIGAWTIGSWLNFFENRPNQPSLLFSGHALLRLVM